MDTNIIWSERKRIWCGLPWTFTKYELRADKLVIRTGFFTQRQDEVRLYRIMDLSLKRSLGQRIFGMGTIKEQLSELVESARRSNRVSTREFMVDVDEEDEH